MYTVHSRMKLLPPRKTLSWIKSYLFHLISEEIWKSIHKSSRDECEQCLWNHALQDLGVRWNVTAYDKPLCKVRSEWQSSEPVASIVFPQTIFCRSCCKRSRVHAYYVVHPNNKHLDTSLKYQRLNKYKSWFLQGNWADLISSSRRGKSWLVSIYKTWLTHI